MHTFLYSVKILISVAAILLSGCMLLPRSTEGVMDKVDDLLTCTVRPDTLIVMLPGAYDKPQDLVDQGFISAVRKRNIYADVQVVDAHLGYYSNQQIIQRLDQEVVQPAKAKGYRNIWFAGISLGGFGSLLYSKEKPGQLTGIFLMAPYMGSREISAQVQKQGGLQTWTPDAAAPASLDIDLWRWLKGYASKSAGMPATYIGFGLSDRFAKPNQLLADTLPKENSFSIPGGHDWITWQQVWASFLDTAKIARIDAASAQCAARPL